MIWLAFLGGFAVLYLALCVGAVLVSRRPYRIPIFQSPGMLGARQENVEFPSFDGVLLSAWWCPAEQAKGVVVLSHGYMMNRSEPAAVAHYFWTQGYSALVYDFPGAGRSQNRICGFGWTERKDVSVAVEYAQSRQPDGPVILWGSSMGAAASAFAAAESPGIADALILDSVYGRLLDAVNGWWLFVGGPWLALILRPTRILGPLFLGFKVDLADVADALRKLRDVPIFLIHGEVDTMATPEQAQRNAAELGPDSRVSWYPGCNHSEPRLFHPQRYREELREFLDTVESSYRPRRVLTKRETVEPPVSSDEVDTAVPDTISS